MKTIIYLCALSTLANAEELEVGSEAPDFALQNQHNKTTKLSDFKGKKNVILAFSRAHWWRFCIQQLVQLEQQKQSIQSLNTEIITVFTEDKKQIEGLNLTVKKAKTDTILLTDLNSEHTKQYTSQGYDTFIIGKNGKILARIDGKKYNRPTGATLLTILKEVVKN